MDTDELPVVPPKYEEYHAPLIVTDDEILAARALESSERPEELQRSSRRDKGLLPPLPAEVAAQNAARAASIAAEEAADGLAYAIAAKVQRAARG